jgi:hypothetical protein
MEKKSAEQAAYIRKEYGEIVGKTVASVRPLRDDELSQFYWGNGHGTVPFVMFFTDGSFVIPMADDEGNGAGTLLYEPAK